MESFKVVDPIPADAKLKRVSTMARTVIYVWKDAAGITRHRGPFLATAQEWERARD